VPRFYKIVLYTSLPSFFSLFSPMIEQYTAGRFPPYQPYFSFTRDVFPFNILFTTTDLPFPTTPAGSIEAPKRNRNILHIFLIFLTHISSIHNKSFPHPKPEGTHITLLFLLRLSVITSTIDEVSSTLPPVLFLSKLGFLRLQWKATAWLFLV